MKSRNSGSFLKTEYTVFEKIAYPFEWIGCRLKAAADERRYRRQRAKRGYAACDLWDMRHWFVRTVGPMLRDMSKNPVSYPPELSEEEWRRVLSEMADLLDILDLWDDTGVRRKAGLAADDNGSNAQALISDERKKRRNASFSCLTDGFMI